MNDDKQHNAFKNQLISGDVLENVTNEKVIDPTSLALRDFEEINAALYHIADQANAAENMSHFYYNIHKIIATLTYAENFFIAIYDEGHQTISFPYIAEINSTLTTEDLAKLPIETLHKTLTGYMLRTGKMLHADTDLMTQLTLSGEILEVGNNSKEWLGYPLKKGEHILGALVIQSYSENLIYTAKDIDLMKFVSQHVASALSRKQAEEALKASELKLREVIENNRAISYKFNLKDNVYEYISNNSMFIFGFTSDEMLAMDYAVLKSRIHPDDRTNYRENFKTLITNSTPDNIAAPVVEYRWLHNEDEEYRWFSDHRTVIFDEKNKATAIIGSVRDITTIIDSEEKLRRNEAVLNKIEELEKIGVLAGGLAHDFNNILTGIIGNISLAKIKLPADHPAYSYLMKSESSIDRAKRLTLQLLTFAKGGEPIKEEVVLPGLIEETVLFDLTGSNVKPVFEFSKGLLEAYLDKGQIQQVISNIVINADQAMPEGGHLYISAEMIELDANQVAELSRGPYIKIEIRDEGTGIDPCFQDRILDPYFTTKEKGSGLGLTTVFSIINKHKGHVSFESEIGKGTKFVIYLPAIKPGNKQKLVITNEQSRSGENYNILVMDDDEDILNLVTDMLEMNNYSVSTALDGQQMLDIYLQSLDKNNPFDAVIMDLTIPGGIGGKEAIVELLNLDAKARCIVSSGYADDPIMSHYQDYGFIAAIPKPYTLDTLYKVLDQVIYQS